MVIRGKQKGSNAQNKDLSPPPKFEKMRLFKITKLISIRFLLDDS